MAIMIHGMVERDARGVLNGLLEEEPAILVEGPRGSGKSTLIRQIAGGRDAVLVDLDDEAVRSLVQQDPSSALRSTGLVVVDEFQRAPDVLSVIKRVVDREGGAGRFLVAGSVSSTLLPTGTETLTGRVYRSVLLPMSAGEVLGEGQRLLPALAGDGEMPLVRSDLRRPDYFELIAAGGYPAALTRGSQGGRQRWFASYLASVADRDLPGLVEIRHPGVLPRLYRLVAQQTSSTLTRSRAAEQLGLHPDTVSAYLGLLAHVHLVREIPAWTAGMSAKAGRRPKVHVTDTGLASAALSLGARRLAAGGLAGAFLESFVVGELAKQTVLVDERMLLGHFRDAEGVEVDAVLERGDGRVIGVEVKAAASVNAADARGLRRLRDRLGDRFQLGVVLHTGPLTVRLSDRVWAAPVSALWGGGGGGVLPEPADAPAHP